MGASEQPGRPAGHPKAHQQDAHMGIRGHLPPLPIEHIAFAVLECAFLSPATSVLGQTRLRCGQIGHNVPRRGAKSITHPLVDAHIDTPVPSFPDSDIGEKLPGVGSCSNAFERYPSMGGMLNLGRLASHPPIVS